MATFTKLEQFADHGKYKTLLKAAVAKGKQTPLRFYYFEKYKFGDKVLPLVLTDADPALVNVVKKTAGNPAAFGTCRLNEDNQLVFEIETGKMDRSKLKLYLSTFPGMQQLWIPTGKEAPEETGRSAPAAAAPKLVERAAPSQTAAAAPARAPNPNAPSVSEVSGAFDRLVQAAKQTALDHPDQKARLTESLGAVQRLIKAGSLDEAQKTLAKAVALVDSLKGVKKEARGGVDPKAAIAAWQAARNQAIAPLKQLIAEIQAMADADGDAAISLVEDIQAKLNVSPATLEQAAAFERYLKTDTAITDAESPNGFGVTINIRKPLLEALTKLKSQLPA